MNLKSCNIKLYPNEQKGWTNVVGCQWCFLTSECFGWQTTWCFLMQHTSTFFGANTLKGRPVFFECHWISRCASSSAFTGAFCIAAATADTQVRLSRDQVQSLCFLIWMVRRVPTDRAFLSSASSAGNAGHCAPSGILRQDVTTGSWRWLRKPSCLLVSYRFSVRGCTAQWRTSPLVEEGPNAG